MNKNLLHQYFVIWTKYNLFIITYNPPKNKNCFFRSVSVKWKKVQVFFDIEGASRLGRKKRRSAKRSGGKRCSWCQPSYIHGGGTNVHHRLPKSRGGTYDEQNLSRVPRHLHDAYNALFGSNPTAHEVARVLSEVWIDPKYRIIVELIEPAIEQT